MEINLLFLKSELFFKVKTLLILISWGKNNYRYRDHIFPYLAPYLLPTVNTFMTCSVYTTVTVALDRYFELSGILKNHPWVKNGRVQCSIVFIFSVLFNFTRWFELEYHIGYDIQNSTSTEEIGINVSSVTLKVGTKFF